MEKETVACVRVLVSKSGRSPQLLGTESNLLIPSIIGDVTIARVDNFGHSLLLGKVPRKWKKDGVNERSEFGSQSY
jgi:hypothetical protein